VGSPAHPAQGDPVIHQVALPPESLTASDRTARRRERKGHTDETPPAGLGIRPDASHVIPMAAADLRPLVEAARAGDRHALDDLVRATYGGTYTLAYRLTGNEDDARDVVQDTYLRAYRGLRRFRGDAQFTTWLYRITANCSANLVAKRARTRTESLCGSESVVDARPESDPERRMAGEDQRARVAAALAQLPWRLRQVIVLRDIYDLPHGSIAAELDISEAAAKVRLHRARRRLRELLLADFDERDEAQRGARAS
jgi:RNA polymerase sigma-70 factor (ECF subfamily)